MQKLKSWILITGAGKRIGFELAKHLASHGQNVLISYRTFYPQIEELTKLGIIAVMADFSTEQGIVNFAEQIHHHCPKLRAIIHNASDWQSESTENLTALSTLFDNMMQIHAKVPYLLNQALLPLLLKNDEIPSDIIHISDYIVQKGSDKHLAYTASKAAMESLTLSFAKKYAPHVKVNTIAPALIAFNEQDDETYRLQAQQKSLMAKCGGYPEMLAAVDYLLQSKYVTGSCLTVNGGRHLK
ncbi:dihydromonapterin reductase [Conservatibacter flavescens]|uniref:Dihydromonapterin reductase n=1 Tax=Conservatibacter flavescens TaxID=28161 RepID=A0A2M8S5D7_9PAST|nr:dihydromonapterin reductase [Conservatibacter flavescens]PJG86362.1 dihydromonapterin reductase [Conservatibacter flavescens]